ncbi:MAG TPA: hypothetical protein VHT70_01805 [Candidatus Saccharimonadales bacterium]|nr:hypothetical protein [Candidatus Saccharimonadales bacterium]
MAKDHYLPAAFIGRFSAETTGRARERPVWAYNAPAQKVIEVNPNAIGHKRGLYDLTDGSVDKWHYYEQQLNRVLDAVAEEQPVSLDDWTRVAVPFVAGLFVRGKEFNTRYEAYPTMKALYETGIITPDNTNNSRILRLQRLLGPVAAARWIVLHNDGDEQLISNNLGLMPAHDAQQHRDGWAIPLDTKTTLGLFPEKLRNVATYEDDTWHATIDHAHPASVVFSELRKESASAATEFIFGPTEDSVREVTDHVQPNTDPLQMAQLMEGPWAAALSNRELVAHEADWRTIASIANLNLSPDDAVAHEYTVNDLNLDKWVPPIVAFPANLTPFPSGVGFQANEMYLNLHLMDDFDSHFIREPGTE